MLQLRGTSERGAERGRVPSSRAGDRSRGNNHQSRGEEARARRRAFDQPLWGRSQGARSSDMIFEIFFAFCMEYCITHNLARLAVSASAQFLLGHKGSPTCLSSPDPLPSPCSSLLFLWPITQILPRPLLPLHMSSLLAHFHCCLPTSTSLLLTPGF